MIMLIDDDFAYAEALEYILQEELPGCRISRFVDGESSLKALNSDALPFTVILDMMVPMNGDDLKGGRPPTEAGQLPRGIEILERLIAAGVRTHQILVITALITPELVRRLLELGVSDSHILFKPARADSIIQIVKQIYARSVK